MANKRFGKYSLSNTAKNDKSNIGDLPIYMRSWEFSLTQLGLARSEWGTGKESVCPKGHLFLKFTVLYHTSKDERYYRLFYACLVNKTTSAGWFPVDFSES